MLPPVMVMGAGAVQLPLFSLQVAIPRPWDAPTTKPPFTSEGTTATHLAESRISTGIPLSGAAIISLSTVAAASARLAALSDAKLKLLIRNAHITPQKNLFIRFLRHRL